MAYSSTSLAHPASENGVGVTTLDPSAGHITIINTYTVAPECGDPNFAARIRQDARIADGFTPILYELRHSVAAPVREDS